MNELITPIHSQAALFRETLLATSIQNGFSARLVEKDYYCSLILRNICGESGLLVFKGGTCISKVFSSFYRLSEDLDFCIHAADSRVVRRRMIGPVKVAVNALPERIAGLTVLDPLSGRNESRQYISALGYVSAITGAMESIKLEIGLREQLMCPAEHRPAKTLLKDAFSGRDIVPPFDVRVMNEKEAWSEKVRAALTRQRPAIRDFYDLDFAEAILGLKFEDPAFLDLVQRKLKEPGNGPVVLSAERKAELERQLESRLQPVLRIQDFEQFSLPRIWDRLASMGALLV